MIDYYISHQKSVIRKRTAFELEKAETAAHILEGLKIALDHLDEVIRIIRASRSELAAKQTLTEVFGLSDKQAQAIVDMRLGRLTGLEREKIEMQYRELLEKIKYYRQILATEGLVLKIIKDELKVIRDKFADKRRTEITADEDDMDIEDLIQEEECVITLTHFGYIKRLPAETYRSQRRGGRGVTGLSTREDDFVETLFITSTHNYILFLTSRGRVYRMKAYEIPEAGRQAKGTAIINLLQLETGEKVSAVIPISKYTEGMYLIMVTKKGHVKKTDLMEYDSIRKGGLTAVTLREGDELIDARLTDGTMDIILVTRNGMSIRFKESDARPLGRVSQGVRGIMLDEDDYVIGMTAYIENTCLLVVTENGFGKRTELDEYKSQTRGGKGILTYRVTERTGQVAGMKLVNEKDDLFLISSDGTVIRIKVCEISILGRATQGVTLMRTGGERKVVSIARALNEDSEGQETEEDPGGDITDENKSSDFNLLK